MLSHEEIIVSIQKTFSPIDYDWTRANTLFDNMEYYAIDPEEDEVIFVLVVYRKENHLYTFEVYNIEYRYWKEIRKHHKDKFSFNKEDGDYCISGHLNMEVNQDNSPVQA